MQLVRFSFSCFVIRLCLSPSPLEHDWWFQRRPKPPEGCKTHCPSGLLTFLCLSSLFLKITFSSPLICWCVFCFLFFLQRRPRSHDKYVIHMLPRPPTLLCEPDICHHTRDFGGRIMLTSNNVDICVHTPSSSEQSLDKFSVSLRERRTFSLCLELQTSLHFKKLLKGA